MAMNEPATPRKQKPINNNHIQNDIVCSTPSQKLKKDVAPLSNYVCSSKIFVLINKHAKC